MQILFGILVGLSYIVSPVVLFWGWARWASRPKLRTVSAILSFLGFILATVSVMLAVSTAVYAQFHEFRFYDPSLLRIMRWGVLLSFDALVLGMSGAWKKSSLRWHTPVFAVGTLAFWILAAAGE